MNLSGKYTLQQVRNDNIILTININNTITNHFLEHLTKIFSGEVTTSPKYAGFGIGIGTSSENEFYTSLENEQLRTSIQTYNNVGTAVLSTETTISASVLQGAGITKVTEVGVFCVNDTDNETIVSSTINTGTLISRITTNIDVEAGDEFIIKRTDTLTGG